MPRARRTPSLARLFDRCPDPIYVIDDRQRIVYANEALLEWRGASRDELIGRLVEYHAHDPPVLTGGGAVAAGLCPPPTAMAGQATNGYVSCTRDGGETVYRRGRFFPLGHGSIEAEEAPVDANPSGPAAASPSPLPVVVLLEGRDRTAAELGTATAHEEPTFQDLHRAVFELRGQRAIRGAGVALVGESDVMRRARRQVDLAASSRSPVLVVGSDAWQRRRVAEALPYVRGESRDEAVVPLDSMLLDENLLSWSLESLTDRGREAATLIFHDIHELPTAAQAFLAERLARWPSHWRVIATCASISGEQPMLETLDLRLFHWLSTLVVDLPPLGSRMEDLPLIAQYLIEETNATSKRQVGGFSQAALDRMHLFDWPGGLVQVRDAVQAAHEATRTPEISVRDLPPPLAHAETAAAYPPERTEPIVLESVLAEIETNLIRRALELAGGNKTQAATLLGMTRPKLYRRLEQLGMMENGTVGL